MSAAKPLVFLIGSPRSGTTLLGEQILSKCDQIHYLGEINHIWKYSNVYKSNEELGVAQINKHNTKFLNGYFKNLKKENAGKVILEKTPTNCLRIPFLHDLFPSARFIFIYRNGFNASYSISKEWSNTATTAIDSADLREKSLKSRMLETIAVQLKLNKRKHSLIDFYESPYYFYRLYQFILRNLFPNKKVLWGPRIPGLKKMANQFGLLDVSARQWSYCMEKVLTDAENIPESNKLVLHYEDLLKSPLETVQKIHSYLDLSVSESVLSEMTASVVDRPVKPGLKEKFSTDSQKIIEGTNSKLGYHS